MRIHRIITGGVVIIVFSSMFLGGIFLWPNHRASSDAFARLLAGDAGVEIKSLTFVGQGRELKVVDSAALAYLGQSFRINLTGSNRPTLNHGYTFYCHVDLGVGTPVEVGCDAPDDFDGLNIAYPYGSLQDSKYYWAPLPQPMPLTVFELLANMRNPGAR